MATNDNEWQQITTSDNEWFILANFPFFEKERGLPQINGLVSI